MNDLLNSTVKEEVKYTTKLHWISYVKPTLLTSIGIILMLYYVVFHLYSYNSLENNSSESNIRDISKYAVLVFLLLWIGKGVLKILDNKMTKIYLTNNNLTLRTGVFSKKLDDISLNKYEGMRIYQSFLGRLLGYGILAISTGELGQSYLIEQPLVLRDFIIKQRN